jgi:hypothetical protein
MFKVKLDDVLNRKHLPPLGSYLRSLVSSQVTIDLSFLFLSGLKDFEEWLLFVEGCPENLSVCLPHFFCPAYAFTATSFFG